MIATVNRLQYTAGLPISSTSGSCHGLPSAHQGENRQEAEALHKCNALVSYRSRCKKCHKAVS